VDEKAMKVAESTSSVPIPESKPTQLASVGANPARGQTSAFGSVLAETSGADEQTASAPLPGRKPASVLPGAKPEAPPSALASAPLPGVKPEVPESLLATAPLPGTKPDVPETLLATAPTPKTKPEVPVTQLAAAPLPGMKPAVPASALAVAATSAERVRLASRQVARISGHSMAAILAQATQESGLDVRAKSKTSSAAGPFQFLERTWLGLFRRFGPAYGLGDLARQVEVRNGIPRVRDAAVRRQILELRHDPDVSAGMAARYLAEGRERLQRKLGRPVSEAESRIAYVRGVGGANRLLRAAEKRDPTPAAQILPAAARANRGLFYDRASGRALSAQETVSRLVHRMETDQQALFAAIDRAATQPVVLDGSSRSRMGAFQSV